MTAPNDRGRRRAHTARRQSGIGLIELMIAMLIGLFVVLGLTLILISMKSASGSQTELGDLQDKERLALSVLTTTIQSARYFPDPMTDTADSALAAMPASAKVSALKAGQGIAGTAAAAAGDASETITSRFVTGPGEAVMDCLGDINTGVGNKTALNTFWVDTTTRELKCSVDGGVSSTVLVSDVESMNMRYGTDTAGPSGFGNPNRYLTQDEVDAGDYWSAVRTVRIVLEFSNPYKKISGQPRTIEWTQTINLMNQT